jgi:hypothetical protein
MPRSSFARDQIYLLYPQHYYIYSIFFLIFVLPQFFLIIFKFSNLIYENIMPNLFYNSRRREPTTIDYFRVINITRNIIIITSFVSSSETSTVSYFPF